MTLINDIMPYFDKFIHVYGWNMSILWSPLKIWMPKNFTTARFRHPVSKSWLSLCIHISLSYALQFRQKRLHTSWNSSIKSTRARNVSFNWCSTLLTSDPWPGSPRDELRRRHLTSATRESSQSVRAWREGGACRQAWGAHSTRWRRLAMALGGGRYNGEKNNFIILKKMENILSSEKIVETIQMIIMLRTQLIHTS